MSSNYSKLDLKAFKARLTSGHYANATGARRGVGKSEMSDDEKKKAYKAIDDHFPDATKASAKAPATAKRPAKASAKAVAKPAAKRGAARGKRSAKAASAKGSKTSAEGAPAASQELADLQAGAQATRESLAGLASAAELDPELDVKAHVRRGATILQHAIDRIGNLLGIPSETPDAEPPAPADAPSGDE